MQHTDKFSQHSSMIWKVWPYGWVFVYELSGCAFKIRCSHLNFRFLACFDQGVPWHSVKYRVWIHSETHMWHDNKIQSNTLCRQVLTIQLKRLVKWLVVCLRSKWFWIRVLLQSLRFQNLRLPRKRNYEHSGNYRVWIHSEMRMWHDNKIQPNAA